MVRLLEEHMKVTLHSLGSLEVPVSTQILSLSPPQATYRGREGLNYLSALINQKTAEGRLTLEFFPEDIMSPHSQDP